VNTLVYVLALFTADAALPVDLGRYDTATECNLQARVVKVHHRGARLRCVRVETRTHHYNSSWAAVLP